MLKRYKLEFSFTLPLPDKRYTTSLVKETVKRLHPMLGADIQIRSEVHLVKRSVGVNREEVVEKRPYHRKKEKVDAGK